MNFLTKTFVVLVMLLSVLLVALQITYVAGQEDLAAELEDAKQRSDAAIAQAEARYTQTQADYDQKVEALGALEGANRDLTSKVNTLEAERETLADQLALAQSEARKQSSTASLLAKNLSAEAERNERLNESLTSTRSTVASQGESVAKLTSELGEKDQEITVLRNQVRLFKEQAVAFEIEARQLRQQNAELVTAAGAVDQDAAGKITPRALTRIEGQVVEVDSELDGLMLVQVDIGSRDGVEEEMTFFVHRGDEYLGELVITKVENGLAVGQVAQPIGAVQPGDVVFTEGL